MSSSQSTRPLSALPTTAELLEAAVAALGGSPRTGQQRMAEAVTRALDVQRHLAVQAGTGTGKSLAYLVPAIRHAQSTGTTVVVSTATIALQTQLVERDLPRLAEALEPLLERAPTFAILKGRSNYLCLNKLARDEDPDALIEEEDLSWVGKQVARLADWANDTDTGDRDTLNPGVPDLAWRQVSVTSRECLGSSRCPQGEDCFAEQARRKAQKVDVVVTNHAMLAIDALSEVSILPEHDVVIIDEAHELDGRITAVATADLSVTALTLAAKRAGKLGGTKDHDVKVTDLAKELDDALVTCNDGRWTTLPEQVQPPLRALTDALTSLRFAIATAPDGEATNDPEKNAERTSLSAHLQELHDSIIRMLEVFAEDDPAKQRDVVWLTRDDRRGDSLKVAPLSVAGLLHSQLFLDNTVVLASATLTIGGNFNAMAASWGLPKGSWDSLDAGTPFNPAKSGILYSTRHLPQPGRDGLSEEFLDELASLITAAGGRTLGLFSSRRAAVQATEAMRARLPFDIFCQGDDSTGVLVDKFAKDENSCLFGTLSLWQGVDVPGSSCSLVVIDRIPFPRPDDPLLQARKEAADAEGRNGFMEVAATHAALLMAQGAGRLLRHVTDRGVVAVLDSRFATKRYGGFLRSSMPALWPTSDIAVVTAALRRLVAS